MSSSLLRPTAGFLLLLLYAADAAGQSSTEVITSHIDAHASEYGTLAQEIWDLSEVGYQETQSSSLLQEQLRSGGFKVESGVAGMPTAFVASYGDGEPVIGLLAEFDALPGITQERGRTTPSPRAGSIAGHACGHHLFGTGSVAAALAVKEWMDRTGAAGTIRLYGTPAEEGGAGKVYMVRAGLFEDVDVALHWHPGDSNSASASSSLANKSAKFRFRGVSAHAAGAPERGRSALDGVEAMNHMVNLMREHVPQETRIHYVITAGGSAPNVIPDFAEVFYYVRNPDPANVLSLFERVVNAAEGAALGTGTSVDYEVIHGIYALLPNETLARTVYENLLDVGGFTYTEEEASFAASIQESFSQAVPPLSSTSEVAPFTVGGGGGGSTDVGDVSWVVPTAGLRTATWVPGTAAHSWQAVAAGGTSIGEKGMVVAAKTLAITVAELFSKPELIEAAREEHAANRGPDWTYVSLVGDRDPPLDYRKPATGNR